jgi:hypothetical protein
MYIPIHPHERDTLWNILDPRSKSIRPLLSQDLATLEIQVLPLCKSIWVSSSSLHHAYFSWTLESPRQLESTGSIWLVGLSQEWSLWRLEITSRSMISGWTWASLDKFKEKKARCPRTVWVLFVTISPPEISVPQGLEVQDTSSVSLCPLVNYILVIYLAWCCL